MGGISADNACMWHHLLYDCIPAACWSRNIGMQANIPIDAMLPAYVQQLVLQAPAELSNAFVQLKQHCLQELEEILDDDQDMADM